MIAVVDYGVGNLFSLTASLNYLGLKNVITRDRKEIESADKIILPGVGAFSDAYEKLKETELIPVLLAEAEREKPLLGICLGMQMLFERSYEYGVHEGLSLIGGEIRPLQCDLPDGLKVPHIGWNSLHFLKNSELFRHVDEGEYVYYVHSYYAKDCLPSTICTSRYGVDVTGAVENCRVFGTQFHPEKSGDTGLRILKGFGELR